MIRVPPANTNTKKKGIEPVLKQRRNQSRSNSRTTAPFLSNSGVFSQGGRNKNQPGRNYQNGNQTQQLMAASAGDDWRSGIHKLMSKVQNIKSSAKVTDEMTQVYTEPADNFRGGRAGGAHSQTAGQIIRKGKMQFGRTSESFYKDVGRPAVDSFLTSPYEKTRRQHFTVFHPDQQQKLQLSSTTSAHMLEAAEHVNLQGETSTQFEYLVNKTFLHNDNNELEKQASRISKLNALCKKVTQDVSQLKRECRQGNYEIDPAFHEDQRDLARTYGGGPAAGKGQAHTKSTPKMMTPLETVTQGINLLYNTGKAEKRGRGERLSHARSGAIQVPADHSDQVPFLPNIEKYKNSRYIDKNSDYANLQYSSNKNRPRRIQSGSSDDSPTTMSKSFLTRGPSDACSSTVANHKRVQSAVNKRSRPVNTAAYQAKNNNLDSRFSPDRVKKSDDGDGQPVPYGQNATGQLQNGRRTQSAIFRPLSNVGMSMSKLEHMSTQNLSQIRSSHFGMRPESSNAPGGAPQMSPDQMIHLLSSQFEQQLIEQPNALQTEAERKLVIEKAIRKLYAEKAPQPSTIAAAATDNQTNKLDNLIQKQKQTKLESISENLKQASSKDKETINEKKTTEHSKKSKVGTHISVKPYDESQSSILTEQLSVKDGRKSPSLKGSIVVQPPEMQSQQQQKDKGKNVQKQSTTTSQPVMNKNKSTTITVQVEDTEADENQQVPLLRHFKSSYAAGGKNSPTKQVASPEISQIEEESTRRGNKESPRAKQLQQDRPSNFMRQKSMDMKQDNQEASDQNLLDAVTNVPLLNLKKAQSTTQGISNSFAAGKQGKNNISRQSNKSQSMKSGGGRRSTNKQHSPRVVNQSKRTMPQQSKNQIESVQPTVVGNTTSQNQDLNQVAREIVVSENRMFARLGNEDDFLDDEDYAYRKERQAKIQSRKLAAVSYDTAVRASKIAGTGALQPVLKDRPPQAQSLKRTTMLSMQTSAKADERLTEIFHSTIDEFKRQLYEQKQEAMLGRVNKNYNDEKNTKNKNDTSGKKGKASAEKNKPKKIVKQGQLQTVKKGKTQANIKKNKNSSNQQLHVEEKIDSLHSHRSHQPKSSKRESVKQSPRVRSSPRASPRGSQKGSPRGSAHLSSHRQMTARDSSRRPSNIMKEDSPAKKNSGQDNPPEAKQSARGVVKMPTDSAAQAALKDEVAADTTQLQNNSPRCRSNSFNSTVGNKKADKKESVKRKNSVFAKQSTTVSNAMRKKLASLQSMGLGSMLGMGDSSGVTQGDTGIMNLNIKTGANLGGSNGRQPRKTKKLLDIIKNFEEEKKKAHMTKDELDLLNLIDEFAPQEEDQSNPATGFGLDLVKKFVPSFIGDNKDKNSTPSVDGHRKSDAGKSGVNSLLQASDDNPVLKKLQGKLSIFQGNNAAKPFGVDDGQSGLGMMSKTKKFMHQPQQKANFIHKSGNLSAKQQFYFDETRCYMEKTEGRASTKLNNFRGSIGEFDDLFEPIEMHKSLPKTENTFLSHPGQEKLYELKHGFKINNKYRHGKDLKLDCNKNPELNSLKTCDPRLTKSLTNLLEMPRFSGEIEKNLHKGEFEEDQIEDAEKHNKRAKKQFLQVKTGLKLDPSWFKVGQSQQRFKKQAADDLGRDVQWKNLQFQGRKIGFDLDNVRNAAYKADRDEKEYIRKMLSTSHGEIANLYRAECDFMVKQAIVRARFESKVDQVFGNSIIPEIESLGIIARSRFITTEEVKQIEQIFHAQDAHCPMMSSMIEHPDNLEFIEFDEVDENLPKDVSVEMQRFGLTRVPLTLSLTKLIEHEIEAPVELLWLLKIDGLLIEAISNMYYSPFRPAPILENFKMEFNILKIDCFQDYLRSLQPEGTIDVTYNLGHYRSKLLKGMLDFFNEQVVQRHDQQTHLALRFSQPFMRRAHRDDMLQRGRYFKPEWWAIQSMEELQRFKRQRLMPELVSGRRENAMELYVSHDIGSVSNHFYEQAKSEAPFRQHVASILNDLVSQNTARNQVSIDTISDDISDGYLDLISESSVGTSAGYLKRLKSSPNKRQIRQKRPNALKNFQKSVTRELQPIKIRFNPSEYKADNQAILVFQQERQIQQYIRTPIRLHEQFQHVWSFKVRVFAEPREGPTSLAYSIIPEGQSKDDFANQDFCFYDVIETTRMPEVVRAMQEKLRKDMEQKIQAFRQGDDGPGARKGSKSSKQKRLGSGNKKVTPKKEIMTAFAPQKADGMETVDIRMMAGRGFQDNESPLNSPLLEASLSKPAMRKSKNKSGTGKRAHSGQGKKGGKKKPNINIDVKAMERHSSDESHISVSRGNQPRSGGLKNPKGSAAAKRTTSQPQSSGKAQHFK